MLAFLQPTLRSELSGALSAQPSIPSDVARGSARCAHAYWPAYTLDEFLLRMAAHGKCVSASMMLCDRSYAVQQLERAQALKGDVALQALVVQLAAYFPGALSRDAGCQQAVAEDLGQANSASLAHRQSSYERMGS